MDFKYFALSRDLFYLAALFLGAGVGCVLNRFRRIDRTRPYSTGRSSGRFRILSVTAGLCFFSGTLAALTIVAILSNWVIFGETYLYLPLGILAAILALAFRFPKAVGFPLILVSGIFVVWMGYSCLRFPVIDGAMGRVILDGNGSAHVRLGAGANFSFQVKAGDPSLEVRVFYVSFSKYFPLFGGLCRGAITEFRAGNDVLYTENASGGKIYSGVSAQPASGRPGYALDPISFHEVIARLDTMDLSPGVVRNIMFEDPELVFR